jgi:hypothetical protein
MYGMQKIRLVVDPLGWNRFGDYGQFDQNVIKFQ